MKNSNTQNSTLKSSSASIDTIKTQELVYRKSYPLKKILELETFNDLRPSKDRMNYYLDEDLMDLAPIFQIVSSEENPEIRLIGGITEQSIYKDAGKHFISLPQHTMLVIYYHCETESDALLLRKKLIIDSFLHDEELMNVYGVKSKREEDFLLTA